MDVPEFLIYVALFLFGLVLMGVVADWLDERDARRDAYRRNHWR